MVCYHNVAETICTFLILPLSDTYLEPSSCVLGVTSILEAVLVAFYKEAKAKPKEKGGGGSC